MNSSTHWTNDAELLERYVLDRLEVKERYELEAHLRTCDRCRSAVREEEELAAGVRRLARDELKSRLKRRLETDGVREFPWLQLAAAAAVIVILIGVGIYGEWFGWYAERQTVGEFREAAKSDTASEGEGTPTPAAAETSKLITKQSRPPQPNDQQRDARTRRASRTAPTAQEDRVAPVGETAVQGKGSERVQLEEIKIAGQSGLGQAFWVNGVILPGVDESAPAALTEMEKRLDARAEQQQRIVVREGMRSQTIILNQRAKSDLSAQKQMRRQIVPTLVERTDEGLQFTVYLDQQVRDEDLRSATIEPVGEDSLILNIGNQQVGYRIPGGWFSQPPTRKE